MELVAAYKKARKNEHKHYMTMESVLNQVLRSYRGMKSNLNTMHTMAYEISEEMKNRNLDRHFQVEILTDPIGAWDIKVHEINKFNKPKECVIWN